jgi:hypothetical protein
MEHLYTLSLLVGHYDMIMFCDDDDTYLNMRVEKFIEAFSYTKEHCDKSGALFGGVRETRNAYNADESPEYWAYGISPSLLSEFFNRTKTYEDLMHHKFADMYLRNYLKRTGGKSMLFTTFVPDTPGLSMYQYTLNNPNSICMRDRRQARNIHTANTIIQNNITLCLICNRNDLLSKHMRDASVPLSRLHDVVPDAKRIIKLTQILYK